MMSNCPSCSGNFVTPHSHPQSFDSGSRPEEMAKREVDLGTGFITVTDHGTLEANRIVYDLCAPGGKFHGKLTPIMGLEGYFRDDNCPILEEMQAPKNKDGEYAGTYKDYLKYMHITMHFLDQEAFETSVKVLSNADLRAEKHGSERKPLFTWSDLELLGSKNTTFCSSCLIGMVGRHLLMNNDHEGARRYYEKLRSITKPGNFYVEIFPHKCDRDWKETIKMTLANGEVREFKPQKNLLTAAGKQQAQYVAEAFFKNAADAREKHKHLRGVMDNRVMGEFDPIDIVDCKHISGPVLNDCRPWALDSDVQLGVNKFVLELAAKNGDPVLISDDSHFATEDEKIVQDVRLAQMGPWRFVNSHHRMSNQQAWDYFRDVMHTPEAEFQKWVETSREFGSRFKDFKFKQRQSLPTKFYPTDTLAHTFKLIQEQGRMDWSNPVRVDRLKREIDLLHRNKTIDLLPYFFIDQEVVDRYRRNGRLTGPGRGSAAGLELAYDLGITHADPIKFGLSLDRFMTPDRIEQGKLPDIDQDLPTRDLLVDPNDENKGWLKDRFGDCVAQISTDGTMKLKSAMRDVARMKLGFVPPDVHGLAGQLPDPPQGITDKDFLFGYKDSEGWVPGIVESDEVIKEYIARYPEHWAIVQKCMGLARQKGRHACAFVFSNDPIDSFIPLTTVGGVRVTQYTKDAVEAAGGLKMDFLNVTALRDIDIAVKIVQDRHGKEINWSPSRELEQKEVPGMVLDGKKVPHIQCVPLNGRYYDIWDLPEEIPVFNMICEGQTDSVFQLGTPGAKGWLKHFNVLKKDGSLKKGLFGIEEISAFTALDRPGPLDAKVKAPDGNEHNMLVEFANRSAGGMAASPLPILDKLLPETYGVIVYQEQLTKIFQEIGGTTGIEAQNFRGDISKKKMEKVIKHGEKFMKGAITRMSETEAKQLWGMMETFGQYGFNKSHAVCYMLMSYATAWLKFHYPLEWWTAVLNGADRNKINQKLWAYCGKYIDFPDIKTSGNSFQIVDERIKSPLWLMMGVGEKAQQQITEMGIPNDVKDLCERIEKFKMDHGSEVEKEVTNKKTGEKVTQKVWKKGRSAINSKVTNALIISGAMDSLFPQGEYPQADGTTLKLPMNLAEKLTYFEDTTLAVQGKKKGKKKAKEEKVASFNDLDIFQLKKSLLPHYSQSLIGMCMPLVKDRMHTEPIHGLRFHAPELGSPGSYNDFTIATGAILESMVASGIMGMTGKDLRYAVFGYVIKDERKSYKDKFSGKNKTRACLTIEADGAIFETVMWPLSAGLHPSIGTSLQGAIVVACLNFRKPKQPTLEYVQVIQKEPTGSNEEVEESKEESKEEKS